MSNDFGYFLITIGVLWILLATPINVSFLTDSLALPMSLIIIGEMKNSKW